MIINETNNCILLSPKKHEDDRGYFQEIYSKEEYKKLGIDVDFVQDNHSVSKLSGTLRGLHFQAMPYAQAKLVKCVKGSLFDVALDIRRGSPSLENGRAIYFLKKTVINFLFQLGLRMVSSLWNQIPKSFTNVLIIIIKKWKEAFYGVMRLSILLGQFLENQF